MVSTSGRAPRAVAMMSTSGNAPRKQLATLSRKQSRLTPKADDVSFDVSDLYLDEDEVETAKQEKRRQVKRGQSKEFYGEFQRKVQQFQFPSGQTSFKSLMDSADELQSLAREARMVAMEKKEEEEIAEEDGALPDWVEQQMDRTVRKQLRKVTTAEIASEHAVSYILGYVNPEMIAKTWKRGVDCDCEQDCKCANDYLNNFADGACRGYLSAVIYEPIAEFILFAAEQEDEALKTRLVAGCRKAVRNVLDGLKTTENNALTIKTLNVLLSIDPDDDDDDYTSPDWLVARLEECE